MSDIGRASRKGTRASNESPACYAKPESPQLLLEENQSITRCGGDLSSETEPPTPIRRLPYDVLRYIFELCCGYSSPVGLPLVDTDLPSRRNPPQLTLLHVCSSWRDTMLRVPTFWNSVRILPVYFNTPQHFDFILKTANEWLHRANGLPCYIDIGFPWDDSSISKDWTNYIPLWNMEWQKKVVRGLLSLHKVKRLRVAFADHHIQDFLSLPEEQLACIEDLSLVYIDLNEDEIPSLESPLDFHKLSNLTSFELSHRQFNFELPRNSFERYFRFASVPWHSLRHIQLYPRMPATFCLDALEQGFCLETCFLIITSDQTVTSQRAPVHLFQLQELEVDVRSPSRRAEVLETFLISLRLPRLKSLALGFSYSHSPAMSIDVPMLLRVQKATQMHLEQLTIHESAVSIDVQLLLIGFPSLRHLELPENVIFTDNAMNEIAAGSLGAFLEHLIIDDGQFDVKKLLHMVKARSHPGTRGGQHGIKAAQFKTAYFSCHDPDGRIQDEVQDLVNEILELGVDLGLYFFE